MNNREIKFRVWNGFKFIGISSPKELLDGYPSSSDYGFIDDLIFQQFTGLKDRNDKEIYEGDIVKVKGYDDWNDEVGFDVIYQIKWCDVHVGFRGFTIKMIQANYSGVGLSEPIEIIGNIFEKPDLIKSN